MASEAAAAAAVAATPNALGADVREHLRTIRRHGGWRSDYPASCLATVETAWFEVVKDYMPIQDGATGVPPRYPRATYADLLELLLPLGLSGFIRTSPAAFLHGMYMSGNVNAMHAVLDARERDPAACPVDVNAFHEEDAKDVAKHVCNVMETPWGGDMSLFKRIVALYSDATLNARSTSGHTLLTLALSVLTQFSYDHESKWYQVFSCTTALLSRVHQDGTGICVIKDTTHRGCVHALGGLTLIPARWDGAGEWYTPSEAFDARLKHRAARYEVVQFEDPERRRLETLAKVLRDKEAQVLAYRAQFLPTLDAALSELLPVDALRHLVIASYALAPS
jgi:hypothetical protein